MANPFLKLTHSNLQPDDPCPHMRTLVSDMASGTLKGLLRLYSHSHINGCKRCSRALAALNSLRADLDTLKAVPPPPLDESRRVAIVAEWERIDQATGK